MKYRVSFLYLVLSPIFVLLLEIGAYAGLFSANLHPDPPHQTGKIAQNSGRKAQRLRDQKASRGDGRQIRNIKPPDAGSIRVTLLGTSGGPGGGGPGMITERMNTSVLVEAADQILLFDAGRGTLLRLAQLGPGYPGSVEKLFLSHLHSDHINDIPDLFLNGSVVRRREALKVWGPPGTKHFVSNPVDAFEWDLDYRSNPRRGRSSMTAFEVQEGTVFDRNGAKVRAFHVDHWPPRLDESFRKRFPAFGYRLEYAGRSVVISGDTRYSENLIMHSKGADIIIHEVNIRPGIRKQGERGRNPGSHHTSPQDAGRVFVRTKAKLGVYYHIILGRLTEEDLVHLTRETYKGPLEVGQDLMQFIVSGDVLTKYPERPPVTD